MGKKTTEDSRAKYWVGILYPENMPEDWQENIGDDLELPYCYCIHNKDICEDGSPRKTHIHLIVCWSNTTTYKHALSVFQSLSAEGKQCCNEIKVINNIRHMYDYLIHDTEDCRKKHKHLYDVSERITGNNFDIGAYEQLSIEDKRNMALELTVDIQREKFTNFSDFFNYVMSNYDKEYFEIVLSYSGLFERLTRGNYQRKHEGDYISSLEFFKKE